MHYPKFKYIIINESLADATQQICCIIAGQRQSADRQEEEIRGILDSFDAARSKYHGE
jgi:guanylate kinase